MSRDAIEAAIAAEMPEFTGCGTWDFAWAKDGSLQASADYLGEHEWREFPLTFDLLSRLAKAAGTRDVSIDSAFDGGWYGEIDPYIRFVFRWT